MPLIQPSSYTKKPWYLINSHMETIIPSLLNNVQGVHYERERLELADGDFLDLDWIKRGHKRLMIIGHGAMGNTDRHYVKRSAKFFSKRSWDILAWNSRGCSGESNRLPRLYHHGETEDLSAVVNHGLTQGYDQIFLLGLSMSGCQTVKYFGEKKANDRVLGGFAVSVSFSLKDTTIQAETRLNGLYGKQFLNGLKEQYLAKRDDHELLQKVDFDKIKSFDELNEQVSIKVFGYKDLDEFYYKASCIHYVEGIDRPVFVLNAKNDPFLGMECYPEELIKDHQFLYAEFPRYGGHVGFTIPKSEWSYMEYAADRFIEEVINK
ncbi:alpha/beta hydrolase [Ekhidna sp. MALMAid0563]|uniref:YheT family hydrolase n=1 Tax=Ekhidna sp. MALMAid0563 TaxID=3143937 RepID=UPI0032DF66A2